MANKTIHHVVIGDDTFELVDEAGREETTALKEDLSESVGDLKNALNLTDDVIFYPTEDAAASTAAGWRLNESDGLCSVNSDYKMVKYTVTAGEIIKVESDDRFQFQTVASVPSSGKSNRVGKTYGIGTFCLVVPNTATYLIVSTPSASNAHVYNTSSIKEKAEIISDTLNNSIHSESAIILNENYTYTAVSSSAWQGKVLNKDYPISGNEKTISISASAANVYGAGCILIIFYADVAKTTVLGRIDLGDSFNNDLHRGYGIPNGTAIVYVQIYLISGSFNSHTPSAGDVAYINELTIAFNTFALNDLMDVPQIKKLKSNMNADGIYKKTSNLLDFGFIGGTWEQGGISDKYNYKSCTKIIVSPGTILYGTIDSGKMQKTEKFIGINMQLYLSAFTSNGSQIGDAITLSDITHQTTGSYSVPNNCEYVIITLSAESSDYDVTPTILDNVVEAFAYVGYEAIRHQEIMANYTPYVTMLGNSYNEHDTSLAISGLLDEQTVRRSGMLYGPISKSYMAKTTSENWQRKSFAIMDNIPVNSEKYVYVIISGRHGLGKRAGVLIFYNADSEIIYQVEIAPELKDGGSVLFKDIIPDGTTKIFAEFEGISNATSAGHSSVINDIYYVKDCYVYLTDDLPDEISNTFDDEWKNAVDDIRKSQGTSLCFGIQTDTHFALKDPSYLGTQLKEMTKQVGFDFIANLGDITRGYSGANFYDNPTNMRKYAEVIMKRYTDGVQCPFLVTIGNHESNVMWTAENPDDKKFSLAELYAQYTKQSVNTSARIESEQGKSYYYIDLIPARVIVLFTNDAENGGFTVSQEQVSWFTNKALDTTKPVLILSHVPLVNGWNPDNLNYSSDYANIMTPLEAFKDNGGTVIACIYGHAHRQEAQKKNGIWHIICTRTETQYTTAEFFIVDLGTYDIKTIGVGNAESRTFTH